MKNRLSRKVVKDLCVSLSKAMLEFKGYELTEEKGYILAETDEEKLLVYFLSKQFSKDETALYKADRTAIKKLINTVENRVDMMIPCIAYGYIKDEGETLETVIVPLEDMQPLFNKGNVFSNAQGHYYYNVDKFKELPPSAMHMSWKYSR